MTATGKIVTVNGNMITVKFDGEYDKSDSYSIKVFSTQNLSLHVNEECYVKYGQDDFTVCEWIDG